MGRKKPCPLDCLNQGKVHTVVHSHKTRAFEPVSPTDARELLKQLGVEQGPWDHPDLNLAYATSAHVFLTAPARIPEKREESVVVCNAGYQRKGVTTWWLMNVGPGSRERRAAPAATAK